MNNTTVKRGIGAVVLALIAAALLAFLLKDKAAQRQEVVEIALPGTTENSGISTQSTRLPTLTTDNSGNGNVIANAGAGNGTNNSASVTTSGTVNTASATPAANSDGTIIASATAATAAAVGNASDTIKQNMDFSVKPKAAKASEGFLELDLVNNGTTSTTPKASTSASQTKPAAPVEKSAPKSSSNTDQGIVIASTSPKSNTRANTVQPRLIGEKRSAPIKSSSTARVIKKTTPAKKSQSASAPAASSATQAKNGYAIQLLATSSLTRANNLKNVMAGEGYPAYVTKTQQNGKTLYRVRIGQYKVKSEAVKDQLSMKRRYKKNTNVNRSAVVAR